MMCTLFQEVLDDQEEPYKGGYYHKQSILRRLRVAKGGKGCCGGQTKKLQGGLFITKEANTRHCSSVGVQ